MMLSFARRVEQDIGFDADRHNRAGIGHELLCYRADHSG